MKTGAGKVYILLSRFRSHLSRPRTRLSRSSVAAGSGEVGMSRGRERQGHMIGLIGRKAPALEERKAHWVHLRLFCVSP